MADLWNRSAKSHLCRSAELISEGYLDFSLLFAFLPYCLFFYSRSSTCLLPSLFFRYFYLFQVSHYPYLVYFHFLLLGHSAASNDDNSVNTSNIRVLGLVTLVIPVAKLFTRPVESPRYQVVPVTWLGLFLLAHLSGRPRNWFWGSLRFTHLSFCGLVIFVFSALFLLRFSASVHSLLSFFLPFVFLTSFSFKFFFRYTQCGFNDEHQHLDTMALGRFGQLPFCKDMYPWAWSTVRRWRHFQTLLASFSLEQGGWRFLSEKPRHLCFLFVRPPHPSPFLPTSVVAFLHFLFFSEPSGFLFLLSCFTFQFPSRFGFCFVLFFKREVSCSYTRLGLIPFSFLVFLLISFWRCSLGLAPMMKQSLSVFPIRPGQAWAADSGSLMAKWLDESP